MAGVCGLVCGLSEDSRELGGLHSGVTSAEEPSLWVLDFPAKKQDKALIIFLATIY